MENIRHTVKRVWGYDAPLPLQAEAIGAVLAKELRARGYDPEDVFSEIGDDIKALASAAGISSELVFQIMFQANIAKLLPTKDTGNDEPPPVKK